ncbi:MAG: 30S ribosomal protein S20 [Candidatus Colwellbacteria bacterium]|nr:30S ribosomal protein S20 [Candidatus Colwellbacteria bacterium]
MPKTKSAKKALRQNVRHRGRNLENKVKLAVILKQYKKLLAADKVDEAQKNLSAVYKVLDKSGKNKLIKKNKASRLKSRLTRQLKAKSTKTSS